MREDGGGNDGNIYEQVVQNGGGTSVPGEFYLPELSPRLVFQNNGGENYPREHFVVSTVHTPRGSNDREYEQIMEVSTYFTAPDEPLRVTAIGSSSSGTCAACIRMGRWDRYSTARCHWHTRETNQDNVISGQPHQTEELMNIGYRPSCSELCEFVHPLLADDENSFLEQILNSSMPHTNCTFTGLNERPIKREPQCHDGPMSESKRLILHQKSESLRFCPPHFPLAGTSFNEQCTQTSSVKISAVLEDNETYLNQNTELRAVDSMDKTSNNEIILDKYTTSETENNTFVSENSCILKDSSNIATVPIESEIDPLVHENTLQKTFIPSDEGTVFSPRLKSSNRPAKVKSYKNIEISVQRSLITESNPSRFDEDYFSSRSSTFDFSLTDVDEDHKNSFSYYFPQYNQLSSSFEPSTSYLTSKENRSGNSLNQHISTQSNTRPKFSQMFDVLRDIETEILSRRSIPAVNHSLTELIHSIGFQNYSEHSPTEVSGFGEKSVRHTSTSTERILIYEFRLLSQDSQLDEHSENQQSTSATSDISESAISNRSILQLAYSKQISSYNETYSQTIYTTEAEGEEYEISTARWPVENDEHSTASTQLSKFLVDSESTSASHLCTQFNLLDIIQTFETNQPLHTSIVATFHAFTRILPFDERSLVAVTTETLPHFAEPQYDETEPSFSFTDVFLESTEEMNATEVHQPLESTVFLMSDVLLQIAQPEKELLESPEKVKTWIPAKPEEIYAAVDTRFELESTTTHAYLKLEPLNEHFTLEVYHSLKYMNNYVIAEDVYQVADVGGQDFSGSDFKQLEQAFEIKEPEERHKKIISEDMHLKSEGSTLFYTDARVEILEKTFVLQTYTIPNFISTYMSCGHSHIVQTGKGCIVLARQEYVTQFTKPIEAVEEYDSSTLTTLIHTFKHLDENFLLQKHEQIELAHSYITQAVPKTTQRGEEASSQASVVSEPLEKILVYVTKIIYAPVYSHPSPQEEGQPYLHTVPELSATESPAPEVSTSKETSAVTSIPTGIFHDSVEDIYAIETYVPLQSSALYSSYVVQDSHTGLKLSDVSPNFIEPLQEILATQIYETMHSSPGPQEAALIHEHPTLEIQSVESSAPEKTDTSTVATTYSQIGDLHVLVDEAQVKKLRRPLKSAVLYTSQISQHVHVGRKLPQVPPNYVENLEDIYVRKTIAPICLSSTAHEEGYIYEHPVLEVSATEPSAQEMATFTETRTSPNTLLHEISAKETILPLESAVLYTSDVPQVVHFAYKLPEVTIDSIEPPIMASTKTQVLLAPLEMRHSPETYDSEQSFYMIDSAVGKRETFESDDEIRTIHDDSLERRSPMASAADSEHRLVPEQDEDRRRVTPLTRRADGPGRLAPKRRVTPDQSGFRMLFSPVNSKRERRSRPTQPGNDVLTALQSALRRLRRSAR